ncbi:MAG TPA: KTSC domain-containing protein [Rhizomicrobium sp.]|jgi:lysyl-tRNA synthetase class 2|nr:KTSC domain-containing protein [Rhizomicrobium sp.]
MPSTVIRSFGYHAAHRTLDIRFVSGRRYVYHDVPAALYDAIRDATSKGEFFNTYIKDRFRFTRDVAAVTHR